MTKQLSKVHAVHMQTNILYQLSYEDSSAAVDSQVHSQEKKCWLLSIMLIEKLRSMQTGLTEKKIA